MKIDLYLVGIGTGNPDHVTQQAVNILRCSDIIMVPRKGSEKGDLANLRYQICDQLLGEKPPAIFEFDIPKRSSEGDYLEAVEQWHEAIANVPAPEEKLKGKIVDVVEKGYMLGDKVLRYSKVVIGA